MNVIPLAQVTPGDFKEFGFNAVLLVMVLTAVGYLAKRVIDAWSAQLERKTTKDMELQERLVVAQEKSYIEHVEIAKAGLKSMQVIESATNKSSISIEMMVISGEIKKRQLDHIEQYTGDLHAAFKDAIEVASDLALDRPDLQKRLLAIRESMDTK